MTAKKPTAAPEKPVQTLSDHFSFAEAACRCGRPACPYSEAKIRDTSSLNLTTHKTAEMLEEVRAFLGGTPMHVNSWWRCEYHNTRVGGEKGSYHVKGMACDITHRTLSAARVQQKMKTKAGRKLIDGLGLYRSFTHLDRRGYVANWDER